MILQILLFAILAILIGLGLVFFGYAAFRVLFPIWGFLIGLWLGADLIVSSTGGGFLATSLGIMLGVILGLIFAGIAYYVYAFAVVLFGLTLGYALGSGLMLALGFQSGFITFLVGAFAAIALAAAFVNLKMPKVYLMVITAFAGASALIAGVLALFGQIPPSRMGLAFIDNYIGNSIFWLIIWLVIGFFGSAVQYQMDMAASSMVPASYSYDMAMADAKKRSGTKAKKA